MPVFYVLVAVVAVRAGSRFLGDSVDDVKGWLEGRDHPVTVESRAGQNEAQNRRALRLAVGPVELLSVPRDLQEPDPLLDVVLVRLLVSLDPGPDLRLLFTPRGDVAAVERLLDLPVQLIQVDLVDSVLEFGVLGIQLLDGAAVDLRLLLLALP